MEPAAILAGLVLAPIVDWGLTATGPGSDPDPDRAALAPAPRGFSIGVSGAF